MISKYFPPKKIFISFAFFCLQSGNIAEHLALVQHHIRTQLDEAKQREMSRLRDLVGRKLRTLSGRTSFLS